MVAPLKPLTNQIIMNLMCISHFKLYHIIINAFNVLAKPAWDSAVGIQIPVQAHVKGIVHNDTAPPHKFDHYYNFIHFSPYPSDVHAMTFEVCSSYRISVSL